MKPAYDTLPSADTILVTELLSAAVALAVEVQARLASETPSASEARASRAEAHLLRVIARIRGPHDGAFAPDRCLEDLRSEVEATDFDGLPKAALHPTLAEFAARARAIKDSSPNDSSGADQVIRTLTAVAHQQGVSGVHGLRLRDHGDWERIAADARARRDRAVARQPLTHRMGLPVDGPETVVEREHLPNLELLSQGKAIVMVGGITKTEKLALIHQRYGLRVDWVEAQGNVRASQVLRDRIKQGSVGALIVLDGLIGHSQYSMLRDAASLGNIPIAHASTGGKRGVRDALRELEKALERRGPERT